MRKIFLFLFFSLACLVVKAKESDSIPHEFLGNGLLFQSVFLDPIQPNFYGTFNSLWKGETKFNGYYLTYAMGGTKSLYRWTTKKNRAYEWAMDLGAFGQFEWRDLDSIMQRNLLNVDFKASLLFNVKWNETYSTRFRFYHISSHNGDDYIIRNAIRSYTPNAVNYEQIDFLHSATWKKLRMYAGGGANVRYETIRKRAFIEVGYEAHLPLQKKIDFFIGTNCRMFQQNSFTPAFNNAIGLSFKGQHKHRLYVVLNYFQGHLPFSQFEATRVNWLGGGIYFN